jgi:diguanylate cyclase (GGDEF)-like protein/PAS domain S-box-containing protein
MQGAGARPGRPAGADVVAGDRFRPLVESSPDALLVVAGDGRLRYANRRALDLLGLDDLEDALGAGPWTFIPEANRPEIEQRHRQVLAERSAVPTRADDVLQPRAGDPVEVETVCSVTDFDGEVAVLVVARVAPGRRRVREALVTAERRFTEAFRQAPTGMLLLDDSGIVLAANAAAGVLAGIDPDAMIGRPCASLLHPEDRELVRTWLGHLVSGEHSAVYGERRIVRPDTSLAWAQISMALLPGDPPTYVVHLVDVTERRETEARLAHQALHDSLTGLPNRTLLFDRLAQAVRAAWRGGPGVTVLYLDLDGFKAINDTRGHAVGDRVLAEVADRLSRILRPADTVARLGGDEFAVVAEGLPQDAASELAERVTDAITEPVQLFDAEGRATEALPIAASVGMAHSSQAPLDVDGLLSAADAAMYRTKQQRRRLSGG